MRKIVSDSKLSDLIAMDTALVSGNTISLIPFLEIKELDGDLKTLVYENYSKFISAADTMKTVFIIIDG
jgi:hypothetical protein